MRLIRIEIPVPVGNCDFASVVRSSTVHTARHALLETSAAFPAIYTDAEDLLDPTAWRALRFSIPVRWALLCDRAFDPRRDLIDLAANAAEQGMLSEWILADPHDTAAGIRRALDEADPDAAKAVWTLVSYIQSIQLSHSDVLQRAWWERRVWRDLLRPYGP